MTKTTKPSIRIHNIETNEVIDREMTDAEFAVYEADKAAEVTRKAEAETKATAKAAAESKLAALGLTTDDLRALGL
jgi:membrane protein involved in colicin uptake